MPLSIAPVYEMPFVGLLVVLTCACAPAPVPVAVSAIPDTGAGDASADSGGRPERALAPRLTDREALALARRWDPNALEGLEPFDAPDFAAAGFAPKGVLYARAADLAGNVGMSGVASDLAQYRGAGSAVGCLAIPYVHEKPENKLVGHLERTWREGGDLITEGFDVQLDRSAERNGPGHWRKVVHADQTTESRASGVYGATLGTYRTSSGGGRIHYDGCTMVVTDVACGVVDVVHDRCAGGARTCHRSRGLVVALRGSPMFCGDRRSSRTTLRSIEHDCAPCEPDPLGDAMRELRRELNGRAFVMQAAGPSFFTTRALERAGERHRSRADPKSSKTRVKSTNVCKLTRLRPRELSLLRGRVANEQLDQR